MKIKFSGYFLELFLIFLVASGCLWFMQTWLEANQFSTSVLWIGNSLLFLLSVISLYLHVKGALHKNPNAFFQSVYASMMLRMFAVLIAVLIYVVFAGSVNKASILACVGLYFIYTFYEIFMVQRMLKKIKNG